MKCPSCDSGDIHLVKDGAFPEYPVYGCFDCGQIGHSDSFDPTVKAAGLRIQYLSN